MIEFDNIENNNIIINDGNFQEQTMMMEVEECSNNTTSNIVTNGADINKSINHNINHECYNNNLNNNKNNYNNNFNNNNNSNNNNNINNNNNNNSNNNYNNNNGIKSEIFQDLLIKLDKASKEFGDTCKSYPKIELENKIFNNGFKPNPKYDKVNCKVVKEINPFSIDEEIELLQCSYAFKKYIKLKLNVLLHCSKSQSEDFEQTFERIFEVFTNWNSNQPPPPHQQLQDEQAIAQTLISDTQSSSSSISGISQSSSSTTSSSIAYIHDQTTNSIAEDIVKKRKKRKVQILIERMIFVRRNGIYFLMFGTYKRTKNLTLIGLLPFIRRPTSVLLKNITNYLYHGRNLINQEFEILTNLFQIKNVNIINTDFSGNN
ncbi:hypothetical protein ACTFIU_002447 [Dictyostelium citrinum]